MKAALPRDFRLYLLISVMGALVHFGQGVAVGWSVYEQTGSSLALGLVGLAQFLPILLFFLLAGRVLDAMMRDRARAGIESLLRQQAPGAMVLDSIGATRWVKAADLEPGDRMLVAAGENFAADGVIEDGSTNCDLSLISGESAQQLVNNTGRSQMS